MEVKASLKYLHIAPRKVRLVADLLPGMSVDHARMELKNLPKRAATPLLKLVNSAAASAKHNFNLDEKQLVIAAVLVDEGLVTKRIRARAFGRAASIRRRTSHVTLTLKTQEVTVRKIKKPPKPIARKIKATDEFKEIEPRKTKDRPTQTFGPVKKSAGFARRIFRRKAI